MSLTASRSAAVALTSAALVGLSALAIPGAAGADEVNCDADATTYSVTGGTIEWGFKQSFRSYFFGMAHGDLTPSEGVTFEGERGGSDGRIVWPVTGGSADSADSVTASGSGTANFSAHGGVMNTTIGSPSVEIDGTAGVLKLDFQGTARDGSPAVGTQAEAATFTLPEAADFQTTGSVTVTGTATLAEQFVPAFGYAAGDEVDPVTVNLTIAQTCGEDGGDDDGDDDGDPNEGEIPGDDEGGIFGSLGKLFDFGS